MSRLIRQPLHCVPINKHETSAFIGSPMNRSTPAGSSRSLWIALLVGTLSLLPTRIDAAEPGRKIAELTRAAKRMLLQRKPPTLYSDHSLTNAAKELDWLEHTIERYGTVVPKHPDVWGESRLTKHRHQVERALEAKVLDADSFKQGLQGALRRSDVSMAALAFALGGAPAEPGGSSAATALIADTPGQIQFSTSAPQGNAFGRFGMPAADSGDIALSLEPTVQSAQLYRYLNHLNALRRINEGDDTADSPGYAMNLLRIPVSVLPGGITRTGYGAEVTFTVSPQLSDDLLPSTIESLAINDVTELNALPLARLFNNDPTAFASYIESFKQVFAQVDNWMEAYDKMLAAYERKEAANENKNSGAIADFRSLRTYLHQRFLEIAMHGLRKSQCDESSVGYYTTTVVCGKRIDLMVLHADMRDFLDRLAQTFSQSENQPNCIPPANPSDATPPCVTQNTLSHSATITIYAQLAGSWYQVSVLLETLENISDYTEGYRGLPLKYKKVKSAQCANNTTKLNPLARQARELYCRESNRGCRVLTESDDGSNAASKQTAEAESRAAIMRHIGTLFTGGADSTSLATFNLLDRYSAEVSVALDRSTTSLLSGVFDVTHSSTFLPQRSRTGARPLSPSQYVHVYGTDAILHIARDAHATLRQHPANGKYHVSLVDIRGYLAEETRAAYRMLMSPENHHLWEHCTPHLADRVIANDFATVNILRKQFYAQLPMYLRHTAAGNLAWGLIVELALLEDKLIRDIAATHQAKNLETVDWRGVRFVGPKESLTPDAHETFKSYVALRWPIIAFALDPDTEDQNIADVFSARRELQLAVSVAVANGDLSPSAAGRFVRGMEVDLETIALNRTAVGFSHGNQTFGWRFHPRVQSPETPGVLGVLGQTLMGGPRRDGMLKDRQMEPASRECTCVVLMPSFVPYVTVESRANWFRLTRPEAKVLTMHDSLRIGRGVSQVRQTLMQPNCIGLQHGNSLGNMHTALQHLEAKLPYQSMTVQIPHENTLGGFDLFERGLTSLAPRLDGWYGAPGINLCEPTSLFLVGDRFSVHGMRVLAGGRSIPFRMLSRQVIEVWIPAGVNTVKSKAKSGQPLRFVDLHVATPYGASSHLLVPTTDVHGVQPGPSGEFCCAPGSATVDFTRSIGGADEESPAFQVRSVALAGDAQLAFRLPPDAAAEATRQLRVDVTEMHDDKEHGIMRLRFTAHRDGDTCRYLVSRSQLQEGLTLAAQQRLQKSTPPLPPTGNTVRWVLRGNVAEGDKETHFTRPVEIGVQFIEAHLNHHNSGTAQTRPELPQSEVISQ